MRYRASAIFAMAVVVRLALAGSDLVPREWILAGAHGEVDAVARSLAITGRYADPYILPTGPTAHPLPIHTALQALIFSAFGFTPAAGWARTVAGIVAFAAWAATMPWLGQRVGLGVKAGTIAGLVSAVIPLHGVDDILGWLWNESLAALALALLIAAFLRRWESVDGGSPGPSFLLGVGAGAAFHLAPPLLLVFAAFLLFEGWWVSGRGRWIGLGSLVAGAVVACVPWGWRVQHELGEPMFIRSNFGLELRLGNHDGARADIWTMRPGRLHPGNNPEEARLVAELGEARYMARARQDAFTWIRDHPGRFLALTGSRIWHVWFGPPRRPAAAIPVATVTVLAAIGFLFARRRLSLPQRAAISIPLLTYPIVYYLVGYVPRYVFPIHGILLLLAASAMTGWRLSGVESGANRLPAPARLETAHQDCALDRCCWTNGRSHVASAVQTSSEPVVQAAETAPGVNRRPRLIELHLQQDRDVLVAGRDAE